MNRIICTLLTNSIVAFPANEALHSRPSCLPVPGVNSLPALLRTTLVQQVCSPGEYPVWAFLECLTGQFDTIFGLHPGFRPAHARGTMLAGTFTPSLDPASLTRAPHIARDSTPVTARFSNATGLPLIPDNDPNANPRGLAIRFHLAERVHTDIICHSTDGFPTRTGQEFLEFLRAAASSDPSKPPPSPIQTFLGSHPKALAFVQTPKPSSSSFARESYFGVTALRFINKDGVSRYPQYFITRP